MTKRFLSFRHAAILLCFLLAPLCQVRSTSVKPELVRCPFCGESYVSDVVTSWFVFESTARTPPEPTGTCPQCLFSWKRQLSRSLSAPEKQRLSAALATWPTLLSRATRRHLMQTLDDQSSNDRELLERYLADVCDSAVRGIAAPRPPSFPGRTAASTDELNERRKLERTLPKIVMALHANKRPQYPEVAGDLEMRSLFTARDLILDGNRDAAEFVLLWLSWADRKAIMNSDFAVQGNLVALAAKPSGYWPKAPVSARVAVVADCVRYVLSRDPMPQSVVETLRSRRWDELSNICLASGSARRDRAAATLLRDRLSRKPDPIATDALADYYKRVGTADDLPQLVRYSIQLYRKERDLRDSWLGFERERIEEAIRTIRFRTLLAGPVEPHFDG
jgi:hypothetical protein